MRQNNSAIRNNLNPWLRPLLLPIALATLCTSLPSQAFGQQPASLTVSEVLGRYRAKYSLEPLSSRLKNLAQAKTERILTSAGTWRAELEAENGLDENKEKRLLMGFTRSQTLGVDAVRVVEQNNLEAEADLMVATFEQRKQEAAVAKLFVRLKYSVDQALASETMLLEINSLVERAKRAAEKGNIGYLSARRWQVLVSKIKGELTLAQRSYATLAVTINKLTDLAISTDIGITRIAAVPVPGEIRQFSADSYIPSRASMLRQKAMRTEASLVKGQREVEGTIGAYHDLESRRSGILVGIGIPLGVSSINAVKAKEILVSKDALQAKNDMEVAIGQSEFNTMSGEITRAREAKSIVEGRVKELSELNVTSQKAFSSGQADASEAIESFNELYEAKVDLAKAEQELTQVALELQLLFYEGKDESKTSPKSR